MLFILLLSPLVFAQTEGTIDSDGAKLHYRIFGSGQPVLIINGGPGLDSDGFVGLAQALSKNNQTIIYDQRGTGKSTVKPINHSAISMDLMVNDIENLRKHLGIGQWVVLGHSFGGMLAAYYATKHPEQIAGLIFSSSGGIDLGLRDYVNTRMNSLLTAAQRDSLQYWNRKLSAGDHSHTVRIGRGRAMAPAYVYRKEFAENIAQRLAQTNLDINRIVWENLEAIHFDCAGGLAYFNKPVLVLQGKNDVLEVKTAEKIHRAFKKSKLVLLDDCGHYGWLDAPTAYFSAIDQFLKSV
ncbi:Alpha/beta hydrolase [Flavobacterium longum]